MSIADFAASYASRNDIPPTRIPRAIDAAFADPTDDASYSGAGQRLLRKHVSRSSGTKQPVIFRLAGRYNRIRPLCVAHLPIAEIVIIPTRNLVLTDHQVDLIDRLVKSERFQNASEVVRRGLRLVESQDAEERERLEALQESARHGVADIEAGRFSTHTSASLLANQLMDAAEERIKAGTRVYPK